MTDHRKIAGLLLLLPLAYGCGSAQPSGVAHSAADRPATGDSYPLVRVAAHATAEALTEAPSARSVQEAHRFASHDEPSQLNEKSLPAPDSSRREDVLPPTINWGDLSPDGLVVPPTDRAPPGAEQLLEPPLPSFADQNRRETSAPPQRYSDAADRLGDFVDRPQLTKPRSAPSAPTKAQPVAAPPAESTTEKVDTEMVVTGKEPRELITAPNWLAESEKAASAKSPASKLDTPEPATSKSAPSDTPEQSAAERGATGPPPAAIETPRPLENSAAPKSLQTKLTPAQLAEMVAVARLADGHSKRGFELAGRNALYSARSEFVQALGMIAQGLDAIEGHTARVESMTAGLVALEESDQFVANTSQLATDFDAVVVGRPHKTPVLHNREAGTTSSMQALQLYYGYAQRQLEFAAGRQPAASMALHGLGKVHAALAKTKGRSAIAAEPKAIVFFQAALLADARNYLASNELGVLLANYGKYPQAKAAFLQSLRVSGQPVTWRNLAVVHSHLNETQFARLALREAQLAAERGIDRQPGPLGLSARPFNMQWVDPQTFSQIGEPPAAPMPTAPEAPRPAVSSLPPRAQPTIRR